MSGGFAGLKLPRANDLTPKQCLIRSPAMASVELGSLAEHFEDDEITAIKAALAEAEVAEVEVDEDAHSVILARDLDDDMFADFVDRLDANDAACDLYLPAEFDVSLNAAGMVVGSSHALLTTLEELRDDLFEDDELTEEPDDEYYEEPDEDEMAEHDPYSEAGANQSLGLKDESMRHMWRILFKGAHESIRSGFALLIRR